MFVHYRSEAFILKRVERGESDRLFTVFTKKFGKLEVLGKAIRKIKSKLRAGVSLFSKSEIEFIQGKTFKILTDAILIEEFKNIKGDLGKLEIALKVSDLLDGLLKGEQKDKKVWRLLGETFDELNNCSILHTLHFLIYYHFFFKLLKILGYSPSLANCAFCQKNLETKIFFSFEQRGLICYPCSRRLKKEGDSTIFEIRAKRIEFLRNLLEKDFSFLKKMKLEPEDLKFLEKFSERYLAFVF